MLYFTQFGTERIFTEMKLKKKNPETKQQNEGPKHGLYFSIRERPCSNSGAAATLTGSDERKDLQAAVPTGK